MFRRDFFAVIGRCVLSLAALLQRSNFASGESVYDVPPGSSMMPADTTTTQPADWSLIDLLVVDTSNHSVAVAALGDTLELQLVLRGTRYSSIMPRECYFSNSRNRHQKISFVIDGCPKKLSADVGKRMERVSNTSYKLLFKAFTFVAAPVTSVDIVCQVTLCISTNENLCTDKCWIPWDAGNAHRLPGAGSFRGGSNSTRTKRWSTRAGGAESITEAVNLIVTSKNYSSATVPSPGWTPAAGNDDTTSTLMYILYGLTGFLALLFIILLLGVICFLFFSSATSPSSVVHVIPAAEPPPLHRSGAAESVNRSCGEQKSSYFTPFHIPRVRSRCDSRSTCGGSSQVPLTSTSSLHWSPSVDSTRSTALSNPLDLSEIVTHGH